MKLKFRRFNEFLTDSVGKGSGTIEATFILRTTVSFDQIIFVKLLLLVWNILDLC